MRAEGLGPRRPMGRAHRKAVGPAHCGVLRPAAAPERARPVTPPSPRRAFIVSKAPSTFALNCFVVLIAMSGSPFVVMVAKGFIAPSPIKG